MTEQTKKNDKKKAFMRAAVEMMEQAKDAVRDKYSKYEGTEETMNDIVNLIEVGKDANLTAAKNAGYTEEELRTAEYTKPNGMEVEKYQKHLKKIGMTDEQIRNRAFGEVQTQTVTASVETKKKPSKKIFSFSKKKEKPTVETENNESFVFDLSKRTVIGEGYNDTNEVQEEKQKNENVNSPEVNNDTTNSINDNNLTRDTNPQILEENSTTSKDEEISESVSKSYGKPTVIKEESKISIEDFDMEEINPMTRYDIIELPSHGECYPSKKGRIPIRELTAADENLIASPNMYVSGTLIDTLIRRCVLDKSFDTDKLCEGDRDAIVLWLRATAFGQEYDVAVKNPESGKEYKAKINLGDFKYKEFNLKGDENGHFEYRFSNGDIAKFKILSFKEIQDVQNEVASQYVNQKKFIVYDMINKIKQQVTDIMINEEGDEPLVDAVDYIMEWANKSVTDSGYADKLYDEFVTKSMTKRTFSINGNTDKKFIEDYISSLRMSESRKYRDYMFNNIPGIDFSFEMPIPESDGGGSFTSFLQYDETIFIG